VAADAAAPRSVSALAWVAYRDDGNDDDDDDDDDGGDRHSGDCGDEYGIVAAFSDGTVTSWSRRRRRIDSSMSNHFLRARLDQGLPHLAAHLIKVRILSSFDGIILPLAAILSR
jgi:hypothetical protein